MVMQYKEKPRAGPADLEALDVIVSWPGEINVSELADELQIDRSTASVRVGRLRRMDYAYPGAVVIPTGKEVTEEPPAYTHMTAKNCQRILDWVISEWQAGRYPTARSAAEHFDWSYQHSRRNFAACRKIGIFYPGHALVPTPRGIDRALNRRT